MHKTLEIAGREYVETAKTKTFIFTLVMVPAIIGGIAVFAARDARKKSAPAAPVKLAVADLSGSLYPQARALFDNHNEKYPARQIRVHEMPARDDPNAAKATALGRLRDGSLDVYAVFEKDILANAGGIKLYTHNPPKTVNVALGTIEYLLQQSVTRRRCEQAGLSPAILEKVPAERIDTAERERRPDQRPRGLAHTMVPFFFMYLMFMGMVGTGQHIISSVIEEKSSRIVELLLSAVSPFDLMAGKILGLAGVGLTVVGFWAGAAYFIARSQGLNVEITVPLLLFFIVYYVLGFLLFSSILAGIGSVCNTIKETQGMMMPVMLVFAIPLISVPKLIGEPDGILAQVLSFLPPVAPMVMILRLSAGTDVPVAQVLASVAFLAAAVIAGVWAAAKVFRTGILMYGKKPGLAEIARWLREL